jgi:hypothetical protein
MFPRDLGYEFAILVVICTVAIFLFPAARGSYSVVHGPVTALLTLRAKLRLWSSIALAALYVLGHIRPVRSADWLAARPQVLLSQAVTLEDISVLRR